MRLKMSPQKNRETKKKRDKEDFKKKALSLRTVVVSFTEDEGKCAR